MNDIKGRRGGNIRNKRTKGRPKEAARQMAAKLRQEAYSKLTLDQKLVQQAPFNGKQYAKLLALKEKQNGKG